MKCPTCRSIIPDDSRFCEFCDAPVGRAVEAPYEKAYVEVPLNPFGKKIRDIVSGPLMLWVIVLLWLQLIFGLLSSGFVLFGFLFTIPELIAFTKIRSGAKKEESFDGLEVLNRYYRFLFFFMIVISALIVIAGIAWIHLNTSLAQTAGEYYDIFSGKRKSISGEKWASIILLLTSIILAFNCLLMWLKREYTRSLYEAVTVGGKPKLSRPLAIVLFLPPLGALAAFADFFLMGIYMSLLYGLLMNFTAGLGTYYFLFLYFASEYKPVIAVLQALCSILASVLAGIIVLDLKKSEQRLI